jgi:DNA-binding protein H-NS
MIRDNEKHFVEALHTEQSSLKYMTQEAKARVHAEIDQRMQELEATGLSSVEILHEEAHHGIKLKDDPFFQLIK